MREYFISTIALLMLSSCSEVTEVGTLTPPATAASSSIEKFDLILQRTSLTGTDFEQYRRLGNNLFVECGQVRQGHFVPNASHIRPLSMETLSQLEAPLNKALQAQAQGHQFDAPGAKPNLFGPGSFELRVTRSGSESSIVTGLDTVVNKTSKPDEALLQIAEIIRSSDAPPCGQRTFYGIGMRKIS